LVTLDYPATTTLALSSSHRSQPQYTLMLWEASSTFYRHMTTVLSFLCEFFLKSCMYRRGRIVQTSFGNRYCRRFFHIRWSNPAPDLLFEGLYSSSQSYFVLYCHHKYSKL